MPREQAPRKQTSSFWNQITREGILGCANCSIVCQLGQGSSKVTLAVRFEGQHEKSMALSRYYDRRRTDFGVMTEALNQGIAASAGLAPSVISFDQSKGVVLSELLPGLTLSEYVAKHRLLPPSHQARIVELLTRVGEAGVDHGDCGNANNFVLDAHARFQLIDFERSRRIRGRQDRLVNLLCICRLLWGVHRQDSYGLLVRPVGSLAAVPEQLVRAFRTAAREMGVHADRAPPELLLQGNVSTFQAPREYQQEEFARCLAGTDLQATRPLPYSSGPASALPLLPHVTGPLELGEYGDVPCSAMANASALRRARPEVRARANLAARLASMAALRKARWARLHGHDEARAAWRGSTNGGSRVGAQYGSARRKSGS